ncbi:MAG: 50S ribosomal protein L22 [Bacteroidia bacterium]|nr:50S ribosomal protein L22 [Bacteroidia bacterium]
MGARKRNTAEARKEAAKTKYQAILRNCPTSPRKMRLVTDLISGKEVNKALDILKYSSQEASRRLEKLLLSAIANWQAKNEGVRLEESNLYVKIIHVDGGRMMKRLQTAPQGRAYRVRKRSNHVTVVLDSRNKEVEENTTK